MSKQLAIFENNKWRVRAFEANNDVYFLAMDVCQCLGLRNIGQAIHALDSDETTTIGCLRPYITGSDVANDFNNLRSSTRVVSESGLYHLIFISRRPEAKQFRRWVTHKVLPAIREHGYYRLDERLTRIEGKRQALHLENKSLKTEIAELKNQIEILQIQTGQHATTHTVSQDDWINFKFYPQAFGPIGMIMSKLASQYELPPRKIKRGMREVNAYNEVLFAMFKLLVAQEQIRIGNRKPRRRS